MKNLKFSHNFFVPVLILSKHPYVLAFKTKKIYLLQLTFVVKKKEQFCKCNLTFF